MAELFELIPPFTLLLFIVGGALVILSIVAKMVWNKSEAFIRRTIYAAVASDVLAIVWIPLQKVLLKD